MSKQCQLTGRKRLVGHKISHSNIKTKKRSQINLKTKKIFDSESGETVRLRVSAKAIRSLDKVGGLSKYLKKNKRLFV
ncbi:MAG: 50S ribosomal protein L28 [Bdellovibrionales bacterium GWA2_49_15]|nr:MAG: 50S ribosomal protein L28 [Bdellovibrionales bacterium GWA2_49_15]HAZ12156.1 50S ribosomal protein L28 [Bdellovibrionales bacterium]